MTLKHLIIPVLLFGLLGSSCKKGAEDPTLSLKSRKARLSGDWKFVSLENNSTTIWNGETGYPRTENGTENEIVRSYERDDLKNTANHKINDYSMTINKDGTWSKRIDLDIVDIVTFKTPSPDEPNAIISAYNFVEEFTGVWSFVGKVKGEYKNKERINLSTNRRKIVYGEGTQTVTYEDPMYPETVSTTQASTTTYTYSTGIETEIYDLLMLKSDEMKWTRYSEGSYTKTQEIGTNGSTTLSEEIIVWKSK